MFIRCVLFDGMLQSEECGGQLPEPTPITCISDCWLVNPLINFNYKGRFCIIPSLHKQVAFTLFINDNINQSLFKTYRKTMHDQYDIIMGNYNILT